MNNYLNQQYMLAMAALLFIGNNLVGAAAPDDPIATLRAHPAYQEESTLIKQMVDQLNEKDPKLEVFKRLEKHCRIHRLARAQADLDVLENLTQASLHGYLNDALQKRAARQAQLANRLQLPARFAYIRESQEYKETLAEIRARTREAKENASKTDNYFDSGGHYDNIYCQAGHCFQGNRFSQAQACLDFLATSKFDYPKVESLNERQEALNFLIEHKHKKKHGAPGILERA